MTKHTRRAHGADSAEVYCDPFEGFRYKPCRMSPRYSRGVPLGRPRIRSDAPENSQISIETWLNLDPPVRFSGGLSRVPVRCRGLGFCHSTKGEGSWDGRTTQGLLVYTRSFAVRKRMRRRAGDSSASADSREPGRQAWCSIDQHPLPGDWDMC